MLRGQFLQDIRGSRARLCFSSAGVRLQIQFVEQNFRELRRRIDVEFHARQFPDFFFQPPHFLIHGLRHLVELAGVHPNARPFHPSEHGSERQVDLLVDSFELLLFHMLA